MSSPTVHSHLITIPHHTFPHFCTQIVRLRDSLSVWCGVAQSHLVQSGEEDAQLQKAHRETGRTVDSSAPIGATAIEWSVAMSGSTSISGTSLFRTPADVASPMSHRLARKLDLPQLFLSLDIPAPLLPNPSVPQAPEDSFALLAIEKGIRDACTQIMAS